MAASSSFISLRFKLCSSVKPKFFPQGWAFHKSSWENIMCTQQSLSMWCVYMHTYVLVWLPDVSVRCLHHFLPHLCVYMCIYVCACTCMCVCACACVYVLMSSHIGATMLVCCQKPTLGLRPSLPFFSLIGSLCSFSSYTYANLTSHEFQGVLLSLSPIPPQELHNFWCSFRE